MWSSVREIPAASGNRFLSNASTKPMPRELYLRWWSAAQNGEINVDDPCTLPPMAASPSSFSARPATVPPWRSKTAWAMPWARIVTIPRDTPRRATSAAKAIAWEAEARPAANRLRRPDCRDDGLQPRPFVGRTPRIGSYLRRKYELDVLDALFPPARCCCRPRISTAPGRLSTPAGTLASQCLGQRHVTSKRPANQEGIKRTVLIPQPGNYSVWVRAFGSGPQSGLRTSVGGKPLAVTHGQGPGPRLAACRQDRLAAGRNGNRRPRRRTRPKRTAMRCSSAPRSPRWPGSRRSVPWPGGCARLPAPAGLRRFSTMAAGSRATSCRAGGAAAHRSPAMAAARPAVRCLLLDGLAADTGRGTWYSGSSDALLEFHNGDRMRGTICGYVAASTEAAGKRRPPGCWCSLLRIWANPRRNRSPSKSTGCGGSCSTRPGRPGAPGGGYIVGAGRLPAAVARLRDGRVIAFRALRFNGDGVSVLTDQGLVRLAYRELAEVAMQPMDAWEAYYRQLAVIDPEGDAGIVRLETGQGMVFTASATGRGHFAMKRTRRHRHAS